MTLAGHSLAHLPQPTHFARIDPGRDAPDDLQWPEAGKP